MKALINLDYRLNPERECIDCVLLGTRHDDHDFTLVVNRYPV